MAITLYLERSVGTKREFWRGSLDGVAWYFTTGVVGARFREPVIRANASAAAARRSFEVEVAKRRAQGFREAAESPLVDVEPTARPTQLREDLIQAVSASGLRLEQATITEVVDAFARFAETSAARPRLGWRMGAGHSSESNVHLDRRLRRYDPLWALELSHTLTVDHRPIPSARIVLALRSGVPTGLPDFEAVDIPRWSAQRFLKAVSESTSYLILNDSSARGRVFLNWE